MPLFFGGPLAILAGAFQFQRRVRLTGVILAVFARNDAQQEMLHRDSNTQSRSTAAEGAHRLRSGSAPEDSRV